MRMASVTDQTAIVNAALALLGSNSRISSIEDGSTLASRARSIWPLVVPFCLSAHPWNFAIRRVLLNEDGAAPAFGWSRRFRLPADCVRWLPPAIGDDGWFEGEREGAFLLTDAAAPLPCRYIARIETVADWSPGFSWLVKDMIGELMADEVTQSEGVVNRMGERIKWSLPKAKRIDGLETGRRRRGAVTPRSDWLAARNRYSPQSGR